MKRKPASARSSFAFTVESLDRRLLLSAVPTLVKDINPATDGSSPHDAVDVNGTLYFAASENGSGHENLWKSDGTPAGTVRVKDFNPSTPGAYSTLTLLTAVNDRLFFTAPDPDGTNNELWTSDGTDAGTHRVKDISPGNFSSDPYWLTSFNGSLYFSATTDSRGRELWRSDGTEAGTVRVRDIFPGASGSDPAWLTPFNGSLYFVASYDLNRAGIWKTDGTEAGTVLFKDISPAYVFDMKVAGSQLFYLSPGEQGLMTLWRSDGTDAGTVPLAKFVWGTSAFPRLLLDQAGVLYFTADDGESGWELWKSDGTRAGTVPVKDINPGVNSSDPAFVTRLNGSIYFAATDASGDRELWKSDGTEAGTSRLKDISPGPDSSAPDGLVAVNGTLFFAASERGGNDDGNRELWKSDGTAAGTVRLADIVPGVRSSTPLNFVTSGGRAFLTATDIGGDRELWSSDGTPGGTQKLADVGRQPLGSNPENFVEVNGSLYFTTRTDATFGELWETDGTAAGTTRVRDVLVSPYATGVNINGTFFFVGYDSDAGWEIWKTDGTAAGTVRLKDTVPGPNNGRPDTLFNYNGALLFSNGIDELWKTDGTAAGTERVSDAVRTAGTFAVLNGVAYFGGYNYSDAGGGGTGTLWRTDGTTDGTYRMGGGFPEDLVVVNGQLFYRADHPQFGNELWKSDGTQAGTRVVKNIMPDDPSGQSRSSLPNHLTPLGNNVLFFAASNATFNRRLWRSDGTEAGTVPLGPDGLQGIDTAVVGDTVYFSTFGNTYGLWKTDGVSVTLVKAFDGNAPTGLTNIRGTLYFNVFTTGSGYELWKSDGTEAGTAQVADLLPGPASSGPGGFTVLNRQTLLFAADHPTAGRELWKLELPGVTARNVFYNASSADGNDAGTDPRDDAAIATDKHALLPGGAAGFANITSYSRGINGVMVDIGALADGVVLTADDFEFRAFTAGGPPNGTPVAAPSAIAVRPGAGSSGIGRVTITWTDAAVRNGWLRVTVKANARTGLASPDTFNFGNLVGDTGGTGLAVDASDVLRTRLNLGRTDLASLQRFDFNRDGIINFQDLLIARVSQLRHASLTDAPALALASTVPAPVQRRPQRRSTFIDVFLD